MIKFLFFLLILTACINNKYENLNLRNLAQDLPTKCTELKADDLSLENLEKFIRNPNCNIKNVNDVLRLLPRELYLNGALAYKSRSLQGPHKIDYMNPRAILQYNGKFFLTYNGNPEDSGYNALEVAEVNVDEKDYKKIMKFQEISFPDTSQNMNWSQIQKQILFSQENPTKCTKCHGIPAHPIFPSYPLWVGFYGFANGKSDPVETKNYQILAEKAQADPQSRYHRFEFTNRILSMRTEGLNDILGRINSAILARKIKKTPNYESYKYSIYAALINCQNNPSFLGDKLADHIYHLDTNLNISKTWSQEAIDKKIKQIVSSQNLFMLDSWRLPMDPQQMNDFNNKYSEYTFPSRSKKLPKNFVDATAKNFKDHLNYVNGNLPFMTKLSMDTFSMQSDYERMYYTPVPLRLIFEGRGIPLNTWALDLTQPTYRFHMTLQNILNHLAEDSRDPLIAELLDIATKENQGDPLLLSPEINNNKEICNKLKKASIKKLAGIKFKAIPISYYEKNIVSGYPSVFQSTCIKCHGEYDFMAPHIPFEDSDKMKNWISISKNADLLKYRVFDMQEENRMPPTRILSDEEKESIKLYLNRFYPH